MAHGESITDGYQVRFSDQRRGLSGGRSGIYRSTIPYLRFFILGVSALIRPLPVTASANVNVMVMVSASLLVFAAMFTGKKRVLDRWEGIMFLVIYTLYTGFLLI